MHDEWLQMYYASRSKYLRDLFWAAGGLKYVQYTKVIIFLLAFNVHKFYVLGMETHLLPVVVQFSNFFGEGGGGGWLVGW